MWGYIVLFVTAIVAAYIKWEDIERKLILPLVVSKLTKKLGGVNPVSIQSILIRPFSERAVTVTGINNADAFSSDLLKIGNPEGTWSAPHALLIKNVKVTAASLRDFATLVGIIDKGNFRIGFQTRMIETLSVEGIEVFFEESPTDKDVKNYHFVDIVKAEKKRRSELSREEQIAWREKWIAAPKSDDGNANANTNAADDDEDDANAQYTPDDSEDDEIDCDKHDGDDHKSAFVRLASMVEKARKKRHEKQEQKSHLKRMEKLEKRELQFKEIFKSQMWVGEFSIRFDLELNEKRGAFTLRGFQGSMHKFEKAILKGLARLAIKSGSAFEAVKERIADNRKERREMVKAKVSDIKDAVVAQHEKVRAKRNEFRSKVGGKLKGEFSNVQMLTVRRSFFSCCSFKATLKCKHRGYHR
eukprot:gene2150-18148_t